MAVDPCRSPESQPRDLLRRYPATHCRAARPRAKDERQGRTAARRGALARRLDTSKESSHTADHADFCVVDAQTSGFGGGGRERLSGREPPPRSCEHGGWRRRSSVRAELRVYGRRPHKRRIHPPIPPTPPNQGGHFSPHALAFLDEWYDDPDAHIHRLCSCGLARESRLLTKVRRHQKPDVCAATSQNVVESRWTHTFVEHLDERQDR